METPKFFDEIVEALERLPLKVVVKCRNVEPVVFLSDKQTVIVNMNLDPSDKVLSVKGKSETGDWFHVLYECPEQEVDLIVNMISAFALSVTRYPVE